MMWPIYAVFCGLAASAQLPPRLENLKTIISKQHPGVSITYKEPGICETTPGVKSYTGHVHFPAGYMTNTTNDAQDYPVNTFFWFFESRKDPENAPLAIWINGGPGTSSVLGAMQENGPCLVEEDSMTTKLNPWSWNNEVNMLYIDQPTQVGFSYNTPTNVTANLAKGLDVRPADFSAGLPQTNLTFLTGTLSNLNISQTSSTSELAAHAMWNFAQIFLGEFPHYKPRDNRVSLWAESYGGHYAPKIFQFFKKQNEKIRNGTINEKPAQYIHLDTLGIVNGLLDAVVQSESWITFPYNNTYGIAAFNQSVYNELIQNYTKPNGCRDQLISCQATLATQEATGVTRKCSIEESCKEPGTLAYQKTDFGWYNIGHPSKDPMPSPHMHGYMLQEEVLRAIGTPVNFTATSGAVAAAFHRTMDLQRGGFLGAAAELLDSGVKLHMMYGDLDYACSWVGGEKASLSIPYEHAKEFSRSGYVPLKTGQVIKGMTRQHGNYSFTRVFQAGHAVPAYQPEAAYEIFMRATFNKDVATGKKSIWDDYSTRGPRSTWHIRQDPPTRPKSRCYVLNSGTCEADVWKRVVAGNVTVKDFWVQDD